MKGNDYDGVLIAVEGLDGAGKSTAVEGIKAWGEQQDDHEVVTTHEPTDMWTGDRVYDALKKDTDSLTDFYLFCADRREHIAKRVEPALKRGAVVVSDRYADSTRAYQTHRVADALDIDYDEARRHVDEIMDAFTIEPDVTIYIDVPVDVAMERCGQEDKFEKRDNLRKVKKAYTRMYSHCDPSCRIVDGTISASYTRHTAVNVVKSETHAKRDSDPRGGADGGGRTYADAVGSREGEE